MKILSPAGNFESLKMAVYYGADEVYLGINDFNARNIDGFGFEDLKNAVDFAHVFGVKVNLAVNILFDNNQLQSALDLVVDAYNLGVDCFIIQDIGLAYLLSKHYPQIEIHASTQMGIHNLEGVRQLQKFGFKRVVLARETPLEEIVRIKENSNIEIEYFAQGALCVCFSGNCYISSYLYNASGNKGKCKQLCRLPYTFEKDGQVLKSGYLLSAKDFNMINNLDRLKNAGVDVIKIEGRARRPFYVAMSTKQYFNAVHGKNVKQQDLALAFNREFTQGYFNGNGNIISDYNNHIGIEIGSVLKVNKGKKFNEVFFSSNKVLSAKSVLKLFSDGVERNTITAYDLKQISNKQYKLTTTQRVFVGDSVRLIVDYDFENQILSFVKRKNLLVKIFACVNKPIKAIIKLQDNQIEVLGDICQSANNQPITAEDLKNNFNKSDIFNANVEICQLDNIFMPKQKLNEFRRNVFESAYDYLTKTTHESLQKVQIDTNSAQAISFDNFQIVEDLNQNFYAENIVYSPECYSVDDVKEFVKMCKKLNKKPFLDTPNFALCQDIKLIEDIINQTKIAIVANNYYAVMFDAEIIIGAGLNVYNNISASVYNKPVICAESDIASKINFAYMTLRHCPFKCLLKSNCANCPYQKGYTYTMENGKQLKLKRKKLSTCTFYLTN